MGATDDTAPDDQHLDASEQRGLERQEFAPQPDPGPMRLFVDFMRMHSGPDGTQTVRVDAVDAPTLTGLDLQEGIRAIFEQPGELQMTGTLRRRRAEATGRDFWEGVLDPHSLIYHIAVAPQTLYHAGPEGCARFASWAPGRLAVPGSQATGDGGVCGDGGDGGDGVEAPKPSGPPTSSDRTMRTPTPWLLLTLGVEGTWEQSHRSLAFDTVHGEATFAEGEPTVLVDDAREVDARVHVWRLLPDADYPDGRRVWVAEPDWSTVRLTWPETDKDT